jgi:hypothetical protein
MGAKQKPAPKADKADTEHDHKKSINPYDKKGGVKQTICGMFGGCK